MFSCPGIHVVFLQSGCDVGDQAAEALARALATNSVLQCLDLSGMLVPETFAGSIYVHVEPTHNCCATPPPQTIILPSLAQHFLPMHSPNTTARCKSSGCKVCVVFCIHIQVHTQHHHNTHIQATHAVRMTSCIALPTPWHATNMLPSHSTAPPQDPHSMAVVHYFVI